MKPRSATSPPMDLDVTRERLMKLGLVHAAEQLATWRSYLEHAVETAQQLGELDPAVDARRIAFELNAFAQNAEAEHELFGDPRVFADARAAIRRLRGRKFAANGRVPGGCSPSSVPPAARTRRNSARLPLGYGTSRPQPSTTTVRPRRPRPRHRSPRRGRHLPGPWRASVPWRDAAWRPCARRQGRPRPPRAAGRDRPRTATRREGRAPRLQGAIPGPPAAGT